MQKRSRQAAFSLIELIVVLAIAAVLLSLGLYVKERVEAHKKIALARSQMDWIANRLDSFRWIYGEYPELIGGDADRLLFMALDGDLDAGGLSEKGHSLWSEERVPVDFEAQHLMDPWGNPYHYYSSVEEGAFHGGKAFVLWSSGPSGMSAVDAKAMLEQGIVCFDEQSAPEIRDDIVFGLNE